jgi:hypothetical protein
MRYTISRRDLCLSYDSLLTHTVTCDKDSKVGIRDALVLAYSPVDGD